MGKTISAGLPSQPPELAGVEHVWIDAGGLRTHLALAGDPGGEPLLLVHGWPQHWLMWRDLIGPLAEAGYRVICPDLRGFGWTDVRGDATPDAFAADLLAALDALEIERTRILAHDWGGFASYLLAARHPERVRALMVLNIPPPWIRIGPRGWLSMWRFNYQLIASSPTLWRLASRTLRRDGRIRRRAIGGATWPPEVAASYMDQFRDPARARSAAGLYRHALTSVEPRIARGRYRDLRLRAPTRVLWGTADVGLSPALLRGATNCADQMEVLRVPGCGHFIAEERTDLVLAEALRFFAD